MRTMWGLFQSDRIYPEPGSIHLCTGEGSLSFFGIMPSGFIYGPWGVSSPFASGAAFIYS